MLGVSGVSYCCRQVQKKIALVFLLLESNLRIHWKISVLIIVSLVGLPCLWLWGVTVWSREICVPLNKALMTVASWRNRRQLSGCPESRSSVQRISSVLSLIAVFKKKSLGSSLLGQFKE
ncbi:hypothetical protein IQ07DRAFT_158309 [Pyrenochaeta sp. DS3sAY3a]|nr:hypothetical protein IQ07DRAFT_158309 [Pyrenochaeta sp. DS3sAY3a]